MEDSVRMLKENMTLEMNTIRFYLDNLEKLNYKANRKKIDMLVLESIKHMSMLGETILKLEKEKGLPLDKNAHEQAHKEETGLQEIYKYEMGRMHDKIVVDLLQGLLDWEKKHEKIVESLV
jgi:rubrerythrin